MIEEVIRHLAKGWQGFLGILARATGNGVRFPADELERLERMHAELAEIIRKQRGL